MRVFPMFGQEYEVNVPIGEGGHGGADPVMLEQATPPPGSRRAKAVRPRLKSIAANQSMRTGQMVFIDDLFPLSSMMKK